MRPDSKSAIGNAVGLAREHRPARRPATAKREGVLAGFFESRGEERYLCREEAAGEREDEEHDQHAQRDLKRSADVWIRASDGIETAEKSGIERGARGGRFTQGVDEPASL